MSNADRTQDMKGWEFVDGSDGKRWVGHVESRTVDTFGNEVVQFSKCLERWPLSTTAVAVPQMQAGGNPLAMRQQAPQMGIAIQSYQSEASSWGPPFGLPYLPPWTIRNPASFSSLSNYPPELQDVFLKTIQGIEAQIEKARTDMKRGSAAASALKLVKE